MTRKRVLLVAQNFYPEFFKSNDIAQELVSRGHHVDVLTGIPNYPEGVFYKGYGIFSRRVDEYCGAKVYRAYQLPRGRKPGAIRLSINYLSFALTTTFWILFFFVFKRRYDAIIVHQTSPITQAWPALLLRAIRRTPVYTWVLDIWPDSVLAFLSKPPRFVEAPLRWFTNLVYRLSKRILISSPDFRALVNRDDDYNDKIIDFPNWCDDILAMPEQDVPTLRKGFNIMLAGNMSDATGLESIVEVIRKTSVNPDIQWVFVGGGNRVEWLTNSIKEHQLEHCCTIAGRFPFSHMSSLYRQADVMFISLKPTDYPHLTATIPARLQSYIAAGKPVIGMIGHGVANLINEIGCGMCAEAGDSDRCAEIILSVAQNREMLAQWSKNARKYYLEHYTKDRCMTHLEKILSE